jgi:hypothetical protein
MDCEDKTLRDAGDDVSMDFEMDALLGLVDQMMVQCLMELVMALSDDVQLVDSRQAFYLMDLVREMLMMKLVVGESYEVIVVS